MSSKIALAASVIATIICVILLYVNVLPKKKDGHFSGKFSQWLHNYFHFKKLYIEEILRFVFILATVFCICAGIFFLLAEDTYSYGRYSYSVSYWRYGLVLLIAGPIALRLVYEFAMMAIIAIRNLIEINNKMSNVVENTAAASNKLSAVIGNTNDISAKMPEAAPEQPAQPEV